MQIITRHKKLRLPAVLNKIRLATFVNGSPYFTDEIWRLKIYTLDKNFKKIPSPA